MYKLNPIRGAWYSCIIEINNDGSFTADYDYDNEPFTSNKINFPYMFKDDFEEYPREIIPDWLDKYLRLDDDGRPVEPHFRKVWNWRRLRYDIYDVF